MLFNSIGYLIFLPIVVALFWLTPFRFRTALLLIASYIFYMFWKPIYGLLILALTIVNYLFGLWLSRARTRRKLILTACIATNLAVLGYFKYAYFAWDVFNQIGAAFGKAKVPPAFEILLPLGISFFVFEFIHYIVDVYKGSQPVRSFPEFALFASFFPTQIAGPIKRFQDFIPQLHVPQKVSVESFNEGIELIVFGLFKKVVVADSLAMVVNRCYAHADLLTGADCWLANWAFAFQVYFDFSGYTDIARGSARLLGFKVPVNFQTPYIAASIADFWRRWHISLSNWLQQYLYFPLGGSKGGEVATCRNIMITMTICGLWHGAAPHYVVWGVYLGLMLVVHRLWLRLKEKSAWLTKVAATRAFHLLGIALTFNAFAAGLALFRAENLGVAFSVLAKMFALRATVSDVPFWQPAILTTTGPIIFAALPLILLAIFAMQFITTRFKETPGIMPSPKWFPAFKPIYLAFLVMLLLVLSPDVTPTFVYFQF